MSKIVLLQLPVTALFILLAWLACGVTQMRVGAAAETPAFAYAGIRG